MSIIYCNVGWMDYYEGIDSERPMGGGAYNLERIGVEAYNFKPYNGIYYGFVEPAGRRDRNGKKSIGIDAHLGANRNAECAEGVLVVWVATKPEAGGQYIVGWYEDAKVYRKMRSIAPDSGREQELRYYNIVSEKATRIDSDRRRFRVPQFRNIWYGNAATDKVVEDYIRNFSQE